MSTLDVEQLHGKQLTCVIDGDQLARSEPNLDKAFSMCRGISVQVRLKFDPRRLATTAHKFELSSIFQTYGKVSRHTALYPYCSAEMNVLVLTNKDHSTPGNLKASHTWPIPRLLRGHLSEELYHVATTDAPRCA